MQKNIWNAFLIPSQIMQNISAETNIFPVNVSLFAHLGKHFAETSFHASQEAKCFLVH